MSNDTLRLIGRWFILAGLGSWHVTGDRSAGGVVGSGSGGGTTDEVFLAAQEAAQAHRDSQGRLILIIFHLPPAPVTIGTRNWPHSLEPQAFLTRTFRKSCFHDSKCKFYDSKCQNANL